jgi:hypothetical protein
MLRTRYCLTTDEGRHSLVVLHKMDGDILFISVWTWELPPDWFFILAIVWGGVIIVVLTLRTLLRWTFNAKR